MSAARFVSVWAATSVAGFSAILWASGGLVMAPRLEFSVPLVQSPSQPAAFVSGSGKEEMGISPRGPFAFQCLVDERVRGTRALRSHAMRSPDWAVELLTDEQGAYRRNVLRDPVLELFGLKRDERDQAIADFLQVRITAAEGVIEIRNPDLAELDPEVPIRLHRARIELDQEGDGIFEMQLDAVEVTCRVDTTSSGEVGLPLREVVARGALGEPVLCVFGADLVARAEQWSWTPERDPLAPANFVFGADLRAEMTSRRMRASSESATRSVLVSPRGGSLRLEPPHVDAEGRGRRNARFDMDHEFRVDQTLTCTDRVPERSWITGGDAWLDLVISSEGESGVAVPSVEPSESSSDAKGRARLVAARVEQDLRAGGTFGELEARAATFGFAPDEENRVRSAECEGPVTFRPPASSDWVAKLFGEERAGALEGPLELRCRGGATLQRPEDLEPERDGHAIELRDGVTLAVAGGPEILRAGRWLRTRFEEPPAAIAAQRPKSDAPKLEPRWMEAESDVRLDHQGQIGEGGHLRVDFEGWGENATRNLVLTESPRVRVQMDPEKAPLDLSCRGPLQLRLGPQGLERAELRDGVLVQPIVEDPAQLHLRCEHLIVAGVGEKELSFEARRGVQYDEADRHVTCERLERSPSGRISVLGVPAVVSIVHEGEPVLLRALWIGYDEAQGSFYALGLAQRVELEPPASLARIDVTGSKAKQVEPEAEPQAAAEPLRIAAHVFAARLLPESTRVLGIGRVRVDGAVEAHADWLWAWKQRTARLTLGAFGGRRIELRKNDPAERVHGTARRMVWGEKDQDLRLLGAPRVRWSGTSDKGFDIIPGLGGASGGEQTYDLRARESLLFTERLVELRGAARVSRVEGKSFEIAGEKIQLQRNLADGEPRRLYLQQEARVRIPSEVPGAPPLLDVQAPQIQWDAKTHELHIRGDKRSGKRATFSFQGKPDTVWYVVIDVEHFIVKQVERT